MLLFVDLESETVMLGQISFVQAESEKYLPTPTHELVLRVKQ